MNAVGCGRQQAATKAQVGHPRPTGDTGICRVRGASTVFCDVWNADHYDQRWCDRRRSAPTVEPVPDDVEREPQVAHDGADDPERAVTSFALARALWDARSNRGRARELAARARDIYFAAGQSRSSDRAMVEAWLAERR
jgi:hypothetical protein